MPEDPQQEMQAADPGETTLGKPNVMGDLAEGRGGMVGKYIDFMIGRGGLGRLCVHELIVMCATNTPGAFGYLMRKKLYPVLVGEVGGGVQWGRNMTIRHGYKVRVGEGSAFDDGVLLDARGVEPGEFEIGEHTLVARDVLIQAKTSAGFVRIGDRCSIGGQTTITSGGGIVIGDDVMIAGQCYIGGGRYRTAVNGVSMMRQGQYTRGPVEIGSDVWVGAGARVLDGVKIGDGAIVGAGAVVTRDVQPLEIVAGVPARAVGTRGA